MVTSLPTQVTKGGGFNERPEKKIQNQSTVLLDSPTQTHAYVFPVLNEILVLLLLYFCSCFAGGGHVIIAIKNF